MITNTTNSIPEIGQIVTVHQRQYVVSDIKQSTIPLDVLSKNGD